MSLRNYETTFIVTPTLSDEEAKGVVEKFKKILTDNGSEILLVDNWGLKKLAYSIEGKNSGFYTVIEFKSEPTFIKTLDIEFRRDERIMRQIIIALDKHAVVYNEKKRNKSFQPTQS
jgi:small subunit ribosomal protein S6